jgi:hypothetical protein
MRKRVAFDLDETLGCPVIVNGEIQGFSGRAGCLDILTRLSERYELVLWTVSNKSYVQKVMAYGLERYFSRFITWDDHPRRWKDVREFDVAYLIDDSDYHRERAGLFGTESRYIVVPPYASPGDERDPLLWVRLIEQALL